MMKQLISLLLSNALVVLSCTSSFGVSFQGEKEAKEIADVKTRIEKLGARTTRVEIKLRNKKKLRGYVQQIAEDYLVISDLKTNTETRVAYTEILQVKEIKDRHLWDRKLFIIAAVIATAFVIAGTYPNEP
jgi:hypothetical protein